MMKWVFAILIIISVISAFFTGSTDAVSNSILNEGANAIQLLLFMLGGMCVWGGLMRIAEKAGITEKLSILFKPLARIIFKGLDLNGKAFKAICMNITANLLGLGNAATPLGMEAMKRLEEEEKTSDKASNNMIVFTVINTASITLIPTTIASLRLKHGAANPLDIIGGVIITSFISITVALTLTLILNKIKK